MIEFIISTLPAGGLAPAGARPPAGTVLASLCHVYVWALVHKEFCVWTCRLSLNVMTCWYVLSFNKCILCISYCSSRQGNLYVDMSFIPKCLDISTHIVVDKTTRLCTWLAIEGLIIFSHFCTSWPLAETCQGPLEIWGEQPLLIYWFEEEHLALLNCNALKLINSWSVTHVLQ